MMYIRAPYPDTTTTIVLPNPEWNNTVRLDSRVSVKQTDDGGIVTYVSSRSGARIYAFDFNLTREKMLELFEFVRAYHSTVWQYEWGANVRRVVLVDNPFMYSVDQRAVYCSNLEAGPVSLGFEEKV